jgi:hypothetical protein
MSSTVYTGEEARAYYVEETTFGTTPTNPTMLCIGVIQEIEPALDPKNIVLRGIGSRNVKAIRRGLRHIDLKMVYTPQNWNFFNYARSLKSTSVEVYYEKTSGIVSLNHKGCKVDRAKVEVSIEDPVKLTMDLIGQDLSVGTAKIGASYETEPSTNPLTGSDCSISKAGAEITRFSDFSFEIVNNLKRQPVIRATTPYLIKSLPERHEVLQGSIRADFESKAELDDILGDTEFTLLFDIGGTNFSFTDCKWQSSRLPTKIEDTVAQTLEWEARGLTIS